MCKSDDTVSLLLSAVGGEGAQASGGYIKSKSLLSLLPPELRQKLDSCLIRDSKRMVLGKVIGEGELHHDNRVAMPTVLPCQQAATFSGPFYISYSSRPMAVKIS